LAAAGEMAFALQNGFGGFVSEVAHVAEESLSVLKVGLQILLTISMSAARCERSFCQTKLIMKYLRSTLTESRQTVEQVDDVTKVIENCISESTARTVKESRNLYDTYMAPLYRAISSQKR